jgi:hypothetical protein
MQMPLLDFAFSYLDRCGRVDLERWRQILPVFVGGYEGFLKER